MPYNGSGVFQRLYSWVNDAAANIKIRADRMDAEFNGMATGLTNCITKDGQTTITSNLPMATYRHTGVGAATARTDYARFDQVQDGKVNWVAAGGTSDAITATYSIPFTALVDGQLCFVRAGAANITTTPTFSANGITARVIVKEGGNALGIGDIAGAGHELIFRYDLANTRWELLNPKAETPSTEFADNVFRIQDNGDATKELAFEVSGITTGTTRTITMPDSDVTLAPLIDDDTFATATSTNVASAESVKAYVDTEIATNSVFQVYESAEIALTSAAGATHTHSLGTTAYSVDAYIICKTAEAGYSVGDKIPIKYYDSNGSSTGIQFFNQNANDVSYRMGSSANVFAVLNKTTGAQAALNNANWRLVIRILY